MRAGEATKILGISRQTLMRWRRKGLISATKLSNGHYDFNEDDIWKLRNGGERRQTVIYARVTTYFQRDELQNQVEILKKYAEKRGFRVHKVFAEVTSGFDSRYSRSELYNLLDMVMNNQVERILVTSRDRLSRGAFNMFRYICEHYATQIIPIFNSGNERTEQEELFQELENVMKQFDIRESRVPFKKEATIPRKVEKNSLEDQNKQLDQEPTDQQNTEALLSTVSQKSKR